MHAVIFRFCSTFLLLLVFISPAFSQCKTNNQTFSSGELGTYQVYYNWGFIWLNAAEVTFETRALVENSRKAYHFVSRGATLSNYDWIFKVRDVYQSKADSATLSPMWFSRITTEGDYSVNNEYRFRGQTIYTKVQNTKQDEICDTLTSSECVFDLLTAIYATRTFSYNQMKDQELVVLKIILDGKIYPLTIRYLGTEIIVNRESIKYRCQKFAVELVAGTIFTGGEDMVVWVSDDEAKVPIKVEAKILVGSIVAHLKDIKGNKWPIAARLN
jgi:hypothetical protein